MSWNKQNTLFIMAGSGYAYDGLSMDGFKVQHPYKGHGIILRILREICFKCPFLPRKVWYVKNRSNITIEYIIVYDALITKEYLIWLKQTYPDAQINFTFNNLITRARHLLPAEIPDGIRIWTYDQGDADNYHIKFCDIHAYCKAYLRPKEEPEYDVFFIGRDKGRAEYILKLERKMNDLGLKTKFIITKDGRLSRNKPFYEKELSYSEMIDYLVKSRSVLNITMQGQTGITLRDIESVFFGIKLITTNKRILKSSYVQRENVFVLDEEPLVELPKFINRPYQQNRRSVLEQNTYERYLDTITEEV